jgi:hypothetical protein
MFDDVPQDKPSRKRMTLHLRRYSAPPTAEDVAALFKHLTGRDATPEDLTKTKRILDEPPSKDPATPGADARVRNARLPETREAVRHRIVAALRRLTEEGGEHNFVILRADDQRNYYLQFATSCGSAVVLGEAVSNLYLQARFALTPGQIATLRRLGWRPPTKRKFPNFYRWWPVITDRDREAIADVALATLERVYRWRSATPLTLRLRLNW